MTSVPEDRMRMRKRKWRSTSITVFQLAWLIIQAEKTRQSLSTGPVIKVLFETCDGPRRRPVEGSNLAWTEFCKVMHYVLMYEVVDDYMARRAAFREDHLRWQVQPTHAARSSCRRLGRPSRRSASCLPRPRSRRCRSLPKADPYVRNGLVKDLAGAEVEYSGRDEATLA